MSRTYLHKFQVIWQCHRAVGAIRHAGAAVWHSEIGFALLAGATGWIVVMVLLTLVILAARS